MPALAATTYGAIKAFVEAQGLSLAVYKDSQLPASSELIDIATGLLKKPYCTLIEDLGITPTSRQDGGSGQGGTTYVTELAQLDLWMNYLDNKGDSLELPRSLAADLHRKLDGCLLDLAPTRVHKCYVQNRQRFVERANNIVHVAYTLSIRRAL